MKRILLCVLFFLPLISSAQNLTPAWVNAIGGAGFEELVNSTFVDPSGNVYISGHFTNTVNFNPGGAATNLTSTGGFDAFFAKYTSTGGLLWAKQLGSTGSDEIYSMTVDGSGNVFVAGSFSGTVDFDPNAGVSNRTSLGGLDIFFGKYSSLGAFSWVNAIGSSGGDISRGIKVDIAGNVYIIGMFNGTVDFDPGASTNFKASAGDSDIFLGGYSTTGTLSWIDTFGSSTYDEVNGIDLDNSNVYITGSYSSTIDLDPGASSSNTTNLGGDDAFFSKYTLSTGALVWWATVRSTGEDVATSILISGTNFYLGGHFSGSASFYSFDGNVTKVPVGFIDSFIAKYNGSTSLPTLSWLNAMGGSSSQLFTNSLALDVSGNVYSTGYFLSSVDFDPTAGTFNLISNGDYDICIASYAQATGSFRFAKSIGGTSSDRGLTVSLDLSNNIYVGGFFSNTVSFDFTSSSQDRASLGFLDGFIAKYAQSSLASEPTAQPSNLTVVDLNSTDFTYDITAAPGVTGGYLHIYRAGTAPTFVPVDGVEYVDDQALPDGSTVKYSDNVPAGNFYGSLNPGTTYHIKIFSYNGLATTRNYLTVAPLSVTITTLTSGTAEPTNQPTGLAFTNITSNSYDFSFTAALAGTNAPDGYISVRKIGSAPTGVPVDGTTYVFPDAIGDGETNFVGTGTSYTQSGAIAGTTYHYAIFSYKGSGSSINYKAVSPLTGSVTTLSSSGPTITSFNPTSGLVASSVTITGTGFSTIAANNTVRFNGTTAAITGTPTATSITATVPTGATSGPITVVVAGQTGTSSTNFTVTTATTPTITSFNPTSGLVGSSVVITGTNFSAIAANNTVRFNGTTATITGTPTTTSITATVPVGATTGTLSVTVGGQTGTSSGTFTVTTALTPTVASFLPISGTIGTSVILTGINFSTTAANNIVKFNGTTATITGTPTATSIATTVPTGATTGKITVEVSGQTGTSLTDFTVTAVSLASEPTNQPTGLVFSNVTSSSYDFSFTAAATGTTAPDGYISIHREGSASTGVPADGITYLFGDALGDGFVNFIGAGTSSSQSSLPPLTAHHLAIYSYKGSGATINYKQVSPLRGSTTTLTDVDLTPPIITGNTTVKTSKAGETIKVSIAASDPESGIASAVIYYGESTSFDWIKLDEPMIKVGNNWEYTIPANVVKEQGVEYKVIVYNGAGDNADTGVLGVTITTDANGPSVPFTSAGTAQSNYKIISIPLDLESKTVNKVFGDDLGDSGDKSKWRMFRYSGGRTSELSGSSSINPGEAYWFISSTNATIDTGVGATVGRISDPFTMQVTQGFNQIGNPYVFNLLWADVQTYSFDTDDNSNLGLGKLRVFNGTGFDDGLVLKRFEGGFVMAAKSGTLVFPAEKNSAAGRTEEKPNTTVPNAIDGADWEVKFELTNGIQNMNFSGIGMNQKASDDYDAYDDFTLPRFLDYIEVNHASKELYNLSYTKDIVPTSENHAWEFFVESNSNELVTMKWDNSFFGNNSKQLVLWDVYLQRGLDMRKENQHIFRPSKSRHLKVFYGDEKFIKEKTAVNQVVFHDVFPNPAKDNVTISFSLPKEDRVTIEVIDLLGKKIATVADGNFKAGYHEVSWNTLDNSGNTITNGIYITQIKGLNSDHQKRLSINK